MLDAEHKSTVEPAVKPRRIGMIALITIVILAVAGVGAWLLLRGAEKTPTDVAQDLARAMRNDDMGLLVETFGSSEENGFLEWHIGLQADPEFTNCEEGRTTSSGTIVSCDVIYGDSFFYSQVLDEPQTTTVMGLVDPDGIFIGQSWPPPAGLFGVEAGLKPWVEANRPELVDQMFGNDFAGLLFTRQSGELRMEVLNDFKASLS